MRRFLPSNGKLVWTAVVTAVVSALISSGAVVRVLQVSLEPIARPDPYTGTQGKAMQLEIDALNARVTRLEAK